MYNRKIICNKHDVFEQTPSKHLSGNGCPICRESKGENIISNYLKNENISFIRQYKFSDCKNVLQLPFDFYIPILNLCIEFNGIQHYEEVKGWGGIKKLKRQIVNDNIKQKYCHNNSIKLLVIKYNEDVVEKLKTLNFS